MDVTAYGVPVLLGVYMSTQELGTSDGEYLYKIYRKPAQRGNSILAS